MRLGRRLSSGIATDPPAPAPREDAPSAPAAPEPRREADAVGRTVAGPVPAER